MKGIARGVAAIVVGTMGYVLVGIALASMG
jgi:hypothetical protein